MDATPDRPNAEKPDGFAGWLLEIINHAGLALLLSVGHRTGLFDVLAGRPASSTEQIARAAGLAEPHVRRWLEGMAEGGIVSRDPDTGLYELPPEHAAHLCGPAPSSNLAALAEFVPLLGAAEDRVVERFQKSGHTPHDARPSFRQEISKEAHQSDRAVVTALLDSILPLVPGLVEALRSGIDVLDVGCGSGRVVNLMARSFPRSQFRGYDPDEQHIEHASFGSFTLGASNSHFQVKDIAHLDEVDRYDLITDFDAIRDEPRPRQVLENIVRALRPGGSFLMQEIAASSHIDESFGLAHDSPLVVAGELAETEERASAFDSLQTVRSLLLESGFDDVTVHRLPHHISHCYFVASKQSR